MFGDPVTCIMVTGKDAFHEQLARAALRCFQEQTYHPRKLIIVNDGPYRLLDDYLPNVSELKFVDNKSHTLGDLRNIGLEAADTPLIAQWDDDDWHHPERLEQQIKALDVGALCLRRQIRYSFVDNSAYILERQSGIEGTVVHSATLQRYRGIRLKEDTYFLSDAFRGRLHVLDNKCSDPVGPGLYIRFAHGHNSWSQSWIMQKMHDQKNSFDLPPKYLELLQRVLQKYYPFMASPAAL